MDKAWLSVVAARVHEAQHDASNSVVSWAAAGQRSAGVVIVPTRPNGQNGGKHGY
jgi:hypothetical protein